MERESERPVGQAGILIAEVNNIFEPALGYIVHRPFWRMGYASEAASACINYAFKEAGYSYILALIRPENLPSRNFA